MGIFNKLFGKSREPPTPQNTMLGGFNSFIYGTSAAGQSVSEQTAMRTTAVYACVRVLSEAIAGLPLHVYQHCNGGGKEILHDHTLDYLLRYEPNSEMSAFTWHETAMTHLLLYGNHFSQIIRNGKEQLKNNLNRS
jgi:phage portal protein BeeE